MHYSLASYTTILREKKRIYLWGLSGIGKSTQGKRIARFLSWQHIDLDHYIEQKEKQTVSDIFSSKGEAYFREVENALLREVDASNLVISVGGGTPAFFNNASWMLENGFCLYLHGTPAFIASRLRNGAQNRPLLQGKDLPELQEAIELQWQNRREFYEQAHFTAEAIAFKAKPFAEAIQAALV